MDIILVLLFGESTWYGVLFTILYIIGLWFMFIKSGIKGWWALIPFAREYMLSECAGREPEGRVTSVLSFMIAIIASVMRLIEPTVTTGNMISGVELSLLILVISLQLIRQIYTIRVYIGLCEVYGKKRRWVLLWLVFRSLPALIWGLSPKYVPAWKVEDIRDELKSIVKHGAAKKLDDGLTVDIRSRWVNIFFRKKVLLRDIHLSIAPGHMVLLLGGSGAGKTVFLDAISGYEKADADILLSGGNIYKQYKKMQYLVGYAPQKDTMRGMDTIYNTLMDAARLRLPQDTRASERRDRVEEVMGIFGLTPSRGSLIDKLSGGQKKRVSIAMELLSNPSLFILDEPDSGLDGVMARELMKALRGIADQGKIIIVITHTPDRVIDLFDDVIVLAKDSKRIGRLAYFGPIDEAKCFFDRDSMEEVVKTINPPSVGGEGRAEEFIARYEEENYA